MHLRCDVSNVPLHAASPDAVSPALTGSSWSSIPDLAVVIPTYNERQNIPLLIRRLESTLRNIAWEAIFVDDDSVDGSADLIAAHARASSHIRLIHRIGRRGLASACIEGMMSTQATFVAVMDADLQHDESILPRMLDRLHGESLDIVVGTRNAAGGSMGEFGQARVVLSRIGQTISHSVCHCELTDPMSGFFMLRRDFLLEVVRNLQGGGFKILVDLLASSPRPVRLAEVGYNFGARRHGESKLNVVVGVEYLFLIVNKLLGDFLPVQFALYLLVGSIDLVVHLVSLATLLRFTHLHFVSAQETAIFIAMTGNFFLNNLITFRDRKLTGIRLLPGLLRYVVACSFGAWANVVLARALWHGGSRWGLASLAGIVLGSVWNLSIGGMFTWQLHRRSPVVSHPEALVEALEVTR